MSYVQHLLHPCDRTIDRTSAVRGVLAGAAVGGLLTTLLMTVGILPLSAPALPAEWPHAAMMAFGMFVWADILATFSWAIAITLIAAPIWAVFNALGVRCWSAAMPLGAVLAPAPFVLVGADDILAMASISIVGAATALVIWLIAYPSRSAGAPSLEAA